MASIVRVDNMHPAVISVSGRTADQASPGPFTRLGVGVTIVIVVSVIAAQFVNYGFLGERVRTLDPGTDRGVFGFVDDVALAAAAAAAWALAARVRPVRPVAVVLAVLLTFLTVDDVVRLHDHIPHWLAFYLPVLAAVFVCLAVLARADPGAGRAVADPVIGAGLLLLLCSFLLHVFGRRLLLDLGFSDSAGLAYQVKAAVKHGTEVAGWFLIALGLLRLRSGPGRRREVR